MGRGWEANTKKDILNLLPIDGSKMRSKDVYAEGRKKCHGYETVEKYLKILEEEGSVNKTIENAKSIWYNRCEAARLKRLIDDFMREINGTLSALPEEMTDFEKKLIEGSRPGSEIEKGIEFLRNDPVYLRSFVITALYHKVNELVKANFSKSEKDIEYYIGDFGQGLHFVPRIFVERALRRKTNWKL